MGGCSACTCARVHVHAFLRVCVQVHVHAHVCMYARIFTGVCANPRAHVCVCVCVYVCGSSCPCLPHIVTVMLGLLEVRICWCLAGTCKLALLCLAPLLRHRWVTVSLIFQGEMVVQAFAIRRSWSWFTGSLHPYPSTDQPEVGSHGDGHLAHSWSLESYIIGAIHALFLRTCR
jgi:hypothetical protein